MKTQQELDHYAVAEIQLSYKTNITVAERPKIEDSNKAHQILKHHWASDKIELQEEFKILLLNRANAVLGLVNISTGGVSATVADTKLIFAAALKANASAVILAHNHPSGNLKASQQDSLLTNKCTQVAKVLDMNILDHIIITRESYLSMADNGLLK